MPEVNILITGYLSNESGGRTCPTVSLVQDNGTNIIVDPGTAMERKLIIEALAKYGLSPDDIDIVFLTHSHYDHFRNLALFPTAKVRDFWGLWNNDIHENAGNQLSKHTQVINTPGHSYDGLTLLVHQPDKTIAICGDVWFKENEPKVDPYAQNIQELLKSRQTIAENADFIIPGHGQMFQNKTQ